MANYIEQFTTGLDWARVFQRTSANPLDRTSMFSSYEDAVLYASGGNDSRGLSGTSYVGQIITVYENDKVDIYKINSDRTLSGIGGESLCFFCDLSNVEIAGRSEENDINSYIITEENSQSVFGTSISELYNALFPKGEENESGETVISD